MHSHRFNQVLQLDIQGTPQAWITLEAAATHVARGAVASNLPMPGGACASHPKTVAKSQPKPQNP